MAFTEYDSGMERLTSRVVEEWAKEWRHHKDNPRKGPYGGPYDTAPDRNIPDQIEFSGRSYSPEELLEQVYQETEICRQFLRCVYDLSFNPHTGPTAKLIPHNTMDGVEEMYSMYETSIESGKTDPKKPNIILGGKEYALEEELDGVRRREIPGDWLMKSAITYGIRRFMEYEPCDRCKYVLEHTEEELRIESLFYMKKMLGLDCSDDPDETEKTLEKYMKEEIINFRSSLG